MKKIVILIFIFAKIGFCVDELLVSGSIAGVSLGLIEARFFGPSLGVGFNYFDEFSNKSGFILTCRSFEIWATPWPGDYMGSFSFASIYLYGIREGLRPAKKITKPVLYGYLGTNFWITGASYLQFGGGIKWIFYALSPAFEWGLQISHMNHMTALLPYLKITLELGGWWPIKLRKE